MAKRGGFPGGMGGFGGMNLGNLMKEAKMCEKHIKKCIMRFAEKDILFSNSPSNHLKRNTYGAVIIIIFSIPGSR